MMPIKCVLPLWLRFLSTYQLVLVLCHCVVTAGEVTATMDTTTELSGTDEEDKREQNDYF